MKAVNLSAAHASNVISRMNRICAERREGEHVHSINGKLTYFPLLVLEKEKRDECAAKAKDLDDTSVKPAFGWGKKEGKGEEKEGKFIPHHSQG